MCGDGDAHAMLFSNFSVSSSSDDVLSSLRDPASVSSGGVEVDGRSNYGYFCRLVYFHIAGGNSPGSIIFGYHCIIFVKRF